MKKFSVILGMLLICVLCVPYTWACDKPDCSHDVGPNGIGYTKNTGIQNTGNNNTINQGGVSGVTVQGGTATGGAGGAGGNATIEKGAVQNTNINAPIANATIEKGAVVNTNNPTFNNKNESNIGIGNGIENFSPKATIEKGAVEIENKNTNLNFNSNNNENKNINKNNNLNVNVNENKNVNVNKLNNTQSQSNTNTFNPTNNNANTQSQSNSNTFTPTNTNSNSQGQQQGQAQSQGQQMGQNNSQTIAPKQEITFEKAYVNAPNIAGAGELNFITGGMRDVTAKFPSFATGTIKPLTSKDCIVDVLYQESDVKFKNLYKEVLKGLRNDKVLTVNNSVVRYQIVEADSTKSWTTGGSLGASGTGTMGTTGAGAAGGLMPQMGRSKVSNLYYVIVVQVQGPDKTPPKAPISKKMSELFGIIYSETTVMDVVNKRAE